MSVTYKFKSLNELAAYLEGKAVDMRSNTHVSKQARGEASARATELENIAHVLRNTIIENLK